MKEAWTLEVILAINLNMSQWQLSETSKWYHGQLYGIFEIPGWIYVKLRFHTSLIGSLVLKLHCQGDWANLKHILEIFQGSCLKVCKVLGEPT